MKTEEITLEGTRTLPSIYFKDGKVSIRGRSIAVNQQQWLSQLIEAMNAYAFTPRKITEIEIRLEYLNSETNRALMNLFTLAEKIYNQGQQVVVRWFCPSNDPVMLEQATIFQSLVDIPFEIELEKVNG